MTNVHPAPVIAAAAQGRLPSWAVVRPRRRDHIARVAALMDRWAEECALPEHDRARWGAAAWLHDALRDADPRELRSVLGSDFRDFPGQLLHGPACAERLRADGVEDEPLLRAIGYHTIGHPELEPIGRALYLADFLEPGRTFSPVPRAVLRARMPASMEAVLIDVVRARIRHLIEARRSLRPETLAFWNALVGGP